MTEQCDIAIIGAGPAGLCAAKTIIERNKGISVIIIEKKVGNNKLIQCAEGVGKRGFHDVLDPKPSWIRTLISHAAFHAPDNTLVTYTDQHKGYIINRALMQHDLLEHCLTLGVQGIFNVSAIALSSVDTNTMTRTIRLSNQKEIRASVVIDCSGPLSCFGKKEQIHYRSFDQEIAYFAHIEGMKTDMDAVHIYVGSSIAPEGYAWVFPRDEQSMNVGIVIGNNCIGSYNLKTLLHAFINRYFKNATILRTLAGPIPCYTDRRISAVPAFIKAGDSLGTVNPISRAGIVEAMKSGCIAGESAVQMLGITKMKDLKKICSEYEKTWFDTLGHKHLKLAKVKKTLNQVTDEEYNRGAHALAAIDQNDLTMSKIFTTCLGKFPKLVWAMRHLM